jgi:hypothetical protein
MRRISSHMTFWYKRVFPVFWFGFVAVFIAAALIGAFTSGRLDPGLLLLLVVPLMMAAFGYVVMRKLIFDLVDEVTDLGDALLIRNADREERIALSEIANVSYSPMINPPRVTLLLRRPGALGGEVTFCAPIRLVPFARSPVIDELIARIDAARRA